MMAWVNDRFYYSIRLLRSICGSYENIYDGLEVGLYVETNPFRLAEYRADFDLARRHLGRRKRKFIELIINGYENGELIKRGFYEVERFKRICFNEMKIILNGGR